MKREYQLDLLRILSMLGIVGLHILYQGGALRFVTPYSVNYYLCWIIEIILMSSVNIFALLTGYLYITKNSLKTKSIINLIATVLFYCISITLLFICLKSDLKVKDIIIGFFPPIAGKYWYITSYIFLFFMIPYLNKFINSISQKQFKKLLSILFILLTVVTTFGLKDYFKIGNGYSPFWLIYMYMIGAYIKINKPTIKTNKCLILLTINIFIIMLSKVAISLITKYLTGNEVMSDIFIQYNSPFILVNSILIFIIFNKIKPSKKENINKLIITISSLMFGIYIIHSHYFFFDFILKDISLNIPNKYLTIYSFGMILLIFVICGIIEFIRTKIFKFLKIDNILEKMSNIFDKLVYVKEEENE